MTQDESNLLLASYRMLFGRSQSMLNKVHGLEEQIYSAQAGLIENEAGCRVSGGNHITRAENIANLVDMKDEYYEYYAECEAACKNTLKLIQVIFTERDENAPELDNKESIKVQRYENILVNYYINNLTQSEIAKNYNYETRYMRKVIVEARRYFYLLYKDNDFKSMTNYLKNKGTDNIVVNYENCKDWSVKKYEWQH